MTIRAIEIGNFKGINKETTITLRPITLLIGKNSSGKSTCLHALAALSQTTKLPNNKNTLVLDDEHASVHLGRFIEVIHSRNYSDRILLGIEVPNVKTGPTFPTTPEAPTHPTQATVKAKYWFKSTLRTQELALDEAIIEFGHHRYEIRKPKARSYNATETSTNQTAELIKNFGFFFDLSLKGTKPSTITSKWNTFHPLIVAQAAIRGALHGTRYLGPFRQAPRRIYPTRGGDPQEVGPEGESAITMLSNETTRTQHKTNTKQVAAWLDRIGVGNSLKLKRSGQTDLFDVSIALSDGNSYSIPDLGYGISQILPVLVQCSFAPKGSTLLFEQPEIHLHKEAARKLSSVFIDTIKKGVGVVIETHSDDLLRGIQEKIREKAIKPDMVGIYSVTREAGNTILKEIMLDENGEYFDSFDALKQIGG